MRGRVDVEEGGVGDGGREVDYVLGGVRDGRVLAVVETADSFEFYICFGAGG